MSEKKDNWERLIHLPDEYEHKPELAQRAIEQIEREKTEKQARECWWEKHWRPMAVSLATCAVMLAVFIPVYHSLNKPSIETPPIDSGADNSSTVYYEEKQLTVEGVADVAAFVKAQGLPLKYFNYPTAETRSAMIMDTHEFAYLKQEMLYIGADGFDQVKLHAVVMADAEFDFAKFFDGFVEEVVILNTSVTYKVKEEIGSSDKEIRAKFSYESVDYYLELVTTGDVETKIEQYVNMLIN